MYAVIPEPGEDGKGPALPPLKKKGRSVNPFPVRREDLAQPLLLASPIFFTFGRPWYVINYYLRLFFTETPFERYLYFIAFKHSREETPEYLKFFSSYIDTTPAWEGTGDNSDVLHPSLVASLDYPYFYNHTYVHFLPGGYVNSKTVRISYLGNSKFTFLNETYVDQW